MSRGIIEANHKDIGYWNAADDDIWIFGHTGTTGGAFRQIVIYRSLVDGTGYESILSRM